MSTPRSQVPYLPGLDGMRALAVVAVMIFHANHSWLPGGYLGVEVFFVISGYLITLLLLGEKERTGRVNLGQFWLRRARRLLPALFVVLAGVVVYLAIFMPDQEAVVRGDVVAGLTYVSNWYQIIAGQGYGAGSALVPLRHLWSLAVEEQFYLVWPLVMVAVLRRPAKRQPAIGMWFVGVSFAIAATVALLYRPGTVPACGGEYKNGLWTVAGRCINVNEMLYLGSLSRAGGLLLGAGFAMLWRPGAIVRGPLRDKGGRLDLLALVALAGLGALMATMYLVRTQYNPYLFRGGFLVTGLLTLVVVAAVTHREAAAGRLLGSAPLRWIGTRSYGLYLYHWPIYQFIRKRADQPLTVTQTVLALALAAIIAEASYRYVETPIRKGRLGDLRRWVRAAPVRMVAAASVVAVVAFAAISMAAASVPSAPVAADDGTTVTTQPPLPSSSTVPGDTAPPSVETTTTVPKVPSAHVAIGESVMEGAKAKLEAAGVLVQTKEGRGPEGVKNAVKLLRDSGDIGAGTTLIIQVGTNAPLSQVSIDAIMAQMPPGMSGVVFMTLHAPHIDYLAANNALLLQQPALHPGVRILDWDAQSANVTLCGDGIHISCSGKASTFYTNLLLAEFGLPAIA